MKHDDDDVDDDDDVCDDEDEDVDTAEQGDGRPTTHVEPERHAANGA